MRLRSIWRAGYRMPLRERLSRTREWAAMTAAWHLPVEVRYWAVVQAGARHASDNPEVVVPDMRFMDVVANHPGGRR